MLEGVAHYLLGEKAVVVHNKMEEVGGSSSLAKYPAKPSYERGQEGIWDRDKANLVITLSLFMSVPVYLI